MENKIIQKMKKNYVRKNEKIIKILVTQKVTNMVS